MIFIVVSGGYNKQVKNRAELYKILEEYNVGERVVLKIKRGNQTLELPIALEEKKR